MKYQVTLFDKQGRYRPISTIVEMKDEYDLKNRESKKKIAAAGVTRICIKKNWSRIELNKSGYTVCKVRRYEK